MSGAKNNKNGRRWIVWAAAAALVLIAAAAAVIIPSLFRQNEVPPQLAPLKLSEGTTAKAEYGYVDTEIPKELEPYTEREMFSRGDTVIFRGSCFGVCNVIVDFNGEKECYCILQIGVKKVYKGSLAEDSAVEILVPHGIDLTAPYTDETDVISRVSSAIDCIFMAVLYDGGSRIEKNGAVLMLKDLADCGLPDGTRWVFLATDEGLVFDREAYPGARDAVNLDRIEKYVLEMLNK